MTSKSGRRFFRIVHAQYADIGVRTEKRLKPRPSSPCVPPWMVTMASLLPSTPAIFPFQPLESLSEGITEYNQRIEAVTQQSYPQTALLKQVKGVVTLIALTYMLTLEDPHRFRKSRDAGCRGSR